MIKYVPFVLLALGGISCGEGDQEEPPVEVLADWKADPVEVWRQWAVFEAQGFKVQAFENNRRDGVLDLQFVTTSSKKTAEEVTLAELYFSCSNADGKTEGWIARPKNRYVTLLKQVGPGLDMNEVGFCSPGFRPYAATATLLIWP